MAKGNILLGMGRGKLGDIVLTRIDGQQIARPRNRQPKNPRTNKQLYQRAVMATVMQAYSAGIKIFDHSFEGKSVGAANQRYFMKLNAKKLRAQIAADIDGDVAVDSQIGRVVAPGVSSPVPACLQVSEGSLIDAIFGGDKTPDALENETVAQYCTRLGLVAGDLFTFVAFAIPDNASTLFTLLSDSTIYSKQFACGFYYARYKVKPEAFASDVEITNFSQILEFSDGNFNPALNFTNFFPGDDKPASIGMIGYTDKDASGWIRSRENEDLRSSCTLEFGNQEFGIASSFALAAWKQGSANLGDSDLILEGGDE
jgi:hypothetical protein